MLSFVSKTSDNDKIKTCNIQKQSKNYKIEGTQFNGDFDKDFVISSYWNHEILKKNIQVSGISCSIRNQKVSFIKIPLLIITFFAWIYFLERTGFILTSLISFNLLILINAGQNIPLKKIIFYMLLGSIFILLLYFGFKNLLLVPLPEGLWFRA